MSDVSLGIQLFTAIQVASSLITCVEAVKPGTMQSIVQSVKRQKTFDRLDNPYKRWGKGLDKVIDDETLQVMVHRVESIVTEIRATLEIGRAHV